MKKMVNTKMRAPQGMFNHVKPGLGGLTPFKHKDGAPLSDIEYFEILGRKALEMDKSNPYKNIPTKYGSYDPEAISVAKEIVKGIDGGLTNNELNAYLESCIQTN